MPIQNDLNCKAINPGLWERWIVLFESIIDYYTLITDEDTRKNYIDSGFYPPESFLTDESLNFLYDESFRSSELLEVKLSGAERHCIIEGLKSFIARYQGLKSKVEKIGLPESILRYYEAFCEESDISERILKWFEITSQSVDSLNSHIEKTNATSLYKIIDGVCIEPIPNKYFEGIINNGYYQEIKYETIANSDEYYISDVGPEIFWSPRQNHIFSFWICTICLQELHSDRDFVTFINADSLIKRNVPDWVDDCFTFPDCEHFLSIPSYDEKGIDTKTASQLLGRPIFKDLCSNEGIRFLLNYKGPYENLSIRRSLTNLIAGYSDKQKILKIVLHTINEETLYWEDNIDAFVGEFNSLEHHKQRLNERESAYLTRKECIDDFHRLFLGQATDELYAALSMGERNVGKMLREYESSHTKELSFKYGLPLLSQEDVRQMIHNCINSNYIISNVICGYLTELSDSQTDTIDITDKYANTVIQLALKEKFVKNDGTKLAIVNGCMTQLANLLVSKELIRPPVWNAAMSAYKNIKELKPRDRIEIAEHLNFRRIDMLFGVSYKNISKAFKNENKDFGNIIDMLWQKHKDDNG